MIRKRTQTYAKKPTNHEPETVNEFAHLLNTIQMVCKKRSLFMSIPENFYHIGLESSRIGIVWFMALVSASRSLKENGPMHVNLC